MMDRCQITPSAASLGVDRTVNPPASLSYGTRSQTLTPAGIQILTRKMKFDFESKRISRYWYRNNAGLTNFLYSLSLLFPEGERFFMDSVRHYRKIISDPALKEHVQGFLGQEAQHSKEHRAYNNRIQEASLNAQFVDDWVRRGLELLRKMTGPLDQLAITTALEHFTAMMATQLLEKPEFADGAHPEHAALWRWHAVEETEHKAVAFDVYKAAGGGYLRRISWMIGVSAGFPFAIDAIWLYLMASDKKILDVKSWWGLMKWLAYKPGFAVGIIPKWFSYFRPDFHPWDYDNSKYIDEWKNKWAPENYAVLYGD